MLTDRGEVLAVQLGCTLGRLRNHVLIDRDAQCVRVLIPGFLIEHLADTSERLDVLILLKKCPRRCHVSGDTTLDLQVDQTSDNAGKHDPDQRHDGEQPRVELALLAASLLRLLLGTHVSLILIARGQVLKSLRPNRRWNA